VPASDESGLELWRMIRTIYRSALKKLNSRLINERVTFSQYNVMLAVSRNGPMPMSKLGENMLVAPANVTGLVDRMESKGYVKRRRDSRDRRVWVVELTPAGQRIFDKISGSFTHYVARIGSDLTREELGSTISSLRKVSRKVEELQEL